MKIVIAMDSFKGTLSSFEAGKIVKTAFLKEFPQAEINVVCVADGGEGTVDAVMRNLNGKKKNVKVLNPLGKTIDAEYGIAGKTAIIEMAAASGLTLLKEEERNPKITTTYGTGQLIKDALKEGAEKIIIGIGGSATNDGGAGMAQALGISIKDESGKEIEYGGENLKKVASIDDSNFDKRILKCETVIACDVDNPLYGKNGASFIYGYQKGANDDDVKMLDNALKHFAKKTEEYKGTDYSKTKGAGAAGGLGFGLMAFCNSTVHSGIDIVLELAQMDKLISNADLIITGEGSMDAQTVNGKTPVGVAKYGKRKNIPVIAIAGQLGDGYEAVYNAGIKSAVASINKLMTFQQIEESAAKQLFDASNGAARLIHLGMGILED